MDEGTTYVPDFKIVPDEVMMEPGTLVMIWARCRARQRFALFGASVPDGSCWFGQAQDSTGIQFTFTGDLNVA